MEEKSWMKILPCVMQSDFLDEICRCVDLNTVGTSAQSSAEPTKPLMPLSLSHLACVSPAKWSKIAHLLHGPWQLLPRSAYSKWLQPGLIIPTTRNRPTLQDYPFLDISAQIYKALAPTGLATGLITFLCTFCLRCWEKTMGHAWQGMVGETWMDESQAKIFCCRTCEVEEFYSSDKSICSLLYWDRLCLNTALPLPFPLVL